MLFDLCGASSGGAPLGSSSKNGRHCRIGFWVAKGVFPWILAPLQAVGTIMGLVCAFPLLFVPLECSVQAGAGLRSEIQWNFSFSAVHVFSCGRHPAGWCCSLRASRG